MQTVILCGGKGTRIRDVAEDVPKPLIEIGGIPTLVHVMNIYSSHGFNDFVLCLGYKGNKIVEYFKAREHIANNESNKWNITFVDTGVETNTGGRIKKIEKYVDGDCFFATYADGISDLDLNGLLGFHKEHKKIATLTAVRPFTHFGILEINKDNLITNFKEKPRLDFFVNGGFFVFSKEAFDHLGENDVLEKEFFGKMVAAKQLCAHKHDGFWMCMDTFKDYAALNDLWNTGKPPWVKK